MQIQSLPNEFHCGTLHYFDGKNLVKCRKINKFFRDFIDQHENDLYFCCMRCEFPKSYAFYNIVERIDWKILYMNCQLIIKGKRVEKSLQNALITNSNAEDVLGKIGIVVFYLGLFNVVLNLAKLGMYGTRAMRDAVREYIKNNPGTTWKQAQLILFPELAKSVNESNNLANAIL